MAEPFISVVIVSYNYGKYLSRALEACQKQTFRDFEIVIVDNGSIDNTNEIIEDFIEQNQNLTVQHIKIEKNIGLPNGRNHGIEAARGKYILFNDADDWMDIDCLAILAAKAKEGDYDRVTVDFRHQSPAGKCTHVVCYHSKTPKWFATMLQGSIFRRSVFLAHKIKVPIGIHTDDTYISTNFALFSGNYSFLSSCHYNVLVHTDSTGGSSTLSGFRKSEKYLDDIFQIFRPIYEKCDEENKILIEYHCIKIYYNNYYQYGRGESPASMYHEYKRARKQMLNSFPCYLKNKNIHIFFDNCDTRYGRIIIGISSLLERLRVYPVALALYGFLSRYIYFSV